MKNLPLKVSIALISIFTSQLYLSAQSRTFIREYTYKASENDSRNTSRRNAIEQAKLLLLEEIGLYVESWVVAKKSESNIEVTDFFKREIKTITAGITETTLLSEKWNGYSYYVKAAITVDTNDILKRINQVLEARINNKEILKLRVLLGKSRNEKVQLSEEIERLNFQLENEKRDKEIKASKLKVLKLKLSSLQQELGNINSERGKIQTALEAIKQEINTKTKLAIESIELMMTRSEVVKLIGQPRSTDGGCGAIYYNYGKVWIIFESGVVSCIINAKYFRSCRDCDSYREYYKKSIIK